MAELKKRFIHTSSTNWASANHADYNESIVFIHDEEKGVAIYTQGATFNTDDVSAENLEKVLKGGKNITLSIAGADSNDGSIKKGDLVIDADSVTSVAGSLVRTVDASGNVSFTLNPNGNGTKLVEAQAVASALTEPISTALTLSTDNKTATFTETYKNLNGDTINATSSVLKAGDNVTFVNDNGLKISATDTKYDLGVESNKTTSPDGVKVNLTSTEVGSDNKPVVKSVEFVKGDNTTVALDGGKVKISAADTTYDISASTSSDNKGVDLKLNTTGTSTSDTIKFTGSGSTTVSVAGAAGAEVITISSTDTNTTYTKVDGSAIVVTQPTEGSTQGTIGLTIPTTEKMLGQTNAGLTTTLNIKYYSKAEGDKLANYIYLLGKDGAEIDKFDASAFVKDSFLKDAKFVTNPADKPAGDYIQFTFQTIDADGEGNPDDIENVVYVPVSEFVRTGTLTYDDAKKQWVADTTTGKLATVTDVASALNSLDADLDATKAAGADTNEIAVVTGITQVDGKITAVDSSLAATKTYVDNKINALDSYIVTDGESADKVPTSGTTDGTGVTANDSKFLSKIVIVDGKLDGAKSEQLNIADAKLVSYQKTSGETNPYVTISSTTTIVDAIEALQAAWDWGTI